VTITLGDSGGYIRDFMGIFLEGQQFDSVTTSGSAPAIRTYVVTVADGQLTLLLDDLGGDPLVTINGLVVREVISLSAMQMPLLLPDAPGSENIITTTENRFSLPPVVSIDTVLNTSYRSPDPFRKEPKIWARVMDVPKKPDTRFAGSIINGQTLEESPVIDLVFSTSLPWILDELEQLSDVSLRPAN
jgi:hypothetical protein